MAQAMVNTNRRSTGTTLSAQRRRDAATAPDIGVGIDAFGLGGSGRAGSDTSYHSDALTHAGSILDFGLGILDLLNPL